MTKSKIEQWLFSIDPNIWNATCLQGPQFLENIRVNQQFLELGISVTGSHMSDPIPGTNLFSFVCSNSSDKPLSGELRLSLAPMVRDCP